MKYFLFRRDFGRSSGLTLVHVRVSLSLLTLHGRKSMGPSTEQLLSSMFDFLDLFVRGSSAASLVLFNHVSEQICSHNVQVEES